MAEGVFAPGFAYQPLAFQSVQHTLRADSAYFFYSRSSYRLAVRYYSQSFESGAGELFVALLAQSHKQQLGKLLPCAELNLPVEPAYKKSLPLLPASYILIEHIVQLGQGYV